MSARVMNCLEELAPRVEQYSIDEMFLDLTGVERCMELGGLRPAAASARV
ncbi:DNA polymerase V subunit UmuC [Klebsiella variicola]|uniref:DNA polymerase V subunit UmuC n=1 Tax=Klebsiella variicola TaxID=244366 RepID=A0A7H4N4B7_KLEVA|nr:DNA polymerase V subunit UmuC [Klebsiella variicola]